MSEARVPLPVTLRKFDLTPEEWLALLADQGGVCAICLKLPPSGRMVIDHEHVPKWKSMEPTKRKTYIRGILCWWCNKNYVGRSITLAKARNVVAYLEAHHRKLYGEP